MPVYLHSIINQFQNVGDIIDVSSINSGHINDTYLVKANKKFVLQKMNGKVFTNIPAMIANKVAISKHLHNKQAALSSKKPVLTFVPTDKRTFFVKVEDNVWCLTHYIKDSVTYESVSSSKIANEAGKITGQFLADCGDYDPSHLTETLPDFHLISKRLLHLDQTIKSADEFRINEAQMTLRKIDQERNSVLFIENALFTNEIPVRVTHNDTKVSNILFGKDDKGLCMIDTDTVMPGAVAYDYGDAIRSICNTAAEDESDLSLVDFNIEYYKAYTNGFLSKMDDVLTKNEIESLAQGIRLMPYIMAVRFVTDYINGDVYYKIKYPEHNLDRAKNQMKLLERIDFNFEEISKTILNSTVR